MNGITRTTLAKPSLVGIPKAGQSVKPEATPSDIFQASSGEPGPAYHSTKNGSSWIPGAVMAAAAAGALVVAPIAVGALVTGMTGTAIGSACGALVGATSWAIGEHQGMTGEHTQDEHPMASALYTGAVMGGAWFLTGPVVMVAGAFAAACVYSYS